MSRYNSAYQRQRAAYLSAVRRELGDVVTCGLCRQPLDLTLSGRSPYRPTVDHLLPLAKGGSLVAVDPSSEWRLLHNVCNSRLGGAVGRHGPRRNGNGDHHVADEGIPVPATLPPDFADVADYTSYCVSHGVTYPSRKW